MYYSEILGVKIASGKREELLSAAGEMIGRGGSILTVNPEILYNSLKNSELHSALMSSLCIPDGIGVVKALSRRGVFTDKLPGVELGEELLDIKPASLAIIGGTPGVAELAMDRLLAVHPLAIFGFVYDGYNYKDEEVISRLQSSPPDIFFVCLGSPKQELFINKMKPYAKGTLFVALGGSADIYSGKLPRAPRLFRKLGLEWLFRILRQPKRIFRTPALAGFVYEVLKEEKKRAKTAENIENKP